MEFKIKDLYEILGNLIKDGKEDFNIDIESRNGNLYPLKNIEVLECFEEIVLS